MANVELVKHVAGISNVALGYLGDEDSRRVHQFAYLTLVVACHHPLGYLAKYHTGHATTRDQAATRLDRYDTGVLGSIGREESAETELMTSTLELTTGGNLRCTGLTRHEEVF